MATYNLTGKYETLLSSLSNDISAEKGKRVSKKQVLEKILDVVLEEERLFSIKEEQPMSFFKRSIYKPPKTKEINQKSSQEILAHVRKLVNKNYD